MFLASIIFIISYFFIITEKGNRALVACIGGVLMLLCGVITFDQALLMYIDWHTVTLLLSMMILVSITSRSGIFEYLAIYLAQAVKGRPIPLLVVIASLTACGSALLNNVTTVLLIVPIIFTITSILQISAIPYLMATILAANIGGTATLIGDPPNVMISQAVDHFTFNSFLIHLGPVVAIIYFLVMTGIVFLYRSKLSVRADQSRSLMAISPRSFIVNKVLAYKSIFVLVITTLGFIAQSYLQVGITSIAMAGALLLMLLAANEHETEEVLQSVEWVTIFFFIGLFMLVGGLEEIGLLDHIAQAIMSVTDGNLSTTALLVLWVSGIVSGFVDNIPFVAAMIPVMLEFESYGVQNMDPLWWALALGACLGGNGTIVGASANVVVAGLAVKAKQPFNYVDFLKVGLPTVIISFVVSTIYLYLRYFTYL
ncbi:ArsB/NhaD family transporter [Paenalkalicoccus suaedae]|uniref:ArsB/NhaD family transporter n=1 Tax=Paenalkalicoccus suaedae TaxID=2592382 RepID=UPI003221A2B3